MNKYKHKTKHISMNGFINKHKSGYVDIGGRQNKSKHLILI